MIFETDVLTQRKICWSFDGKPKSYHGYRNVACYDGLDYFYKIGNAKKIVIVASNRPVKNTETVEVSRVQRALRVAMERVGYAPRNDSKLWWWVEILEEF